MRGSQVRFCFYPTGMLDLDDSRLTHAEASLCISMDEQGFVTSYTLTTIASVLSTGNFMEETPLKQQQQQPWQVIGSCQANASMTY